MSIGAAGIAHGLPGNKSHPVMQDGSSTSTRHPIAGLAEVGVPIHQIFEGKDFFLLILKWFVLLWKCT